MNKTNNKINILILLFFLFVLFSVLEGYTCKYYGEPQHLAKIQDKNYLPKYCTDIFKNYWSENGVIEYLQVTLLMLAIYLLFSTRKFFYHNYKYIYYLIIIKILGLTYFLGEEISWGQHIFQWESSEFFINQFLQEEFLSNMHSVKKNSENVSTYCFIIIFGIINMHDE